MLFVYECELCHPDSIVTNQKRPPADYALASGLTDADIKFSFYQRPNSSHTVICRIFSVGLTLKLNFYNDLYYSVLLLEFL